MINKILNLYIFKKIIIICFFFFLSFVFFLSFDFKNWINFWGNNLHIPPGPMPFHDFFQINNAYLSYKDGFDPYIYNPHNGLDQINRYNYPVVWLSVFKFFNQISSYGLIFFQFLILFFYFLIISNFINVLRSKAEVLSFIVFIFSTSNFLLIERLNIEILIFCFVYISIKLKNNFLKNFFYFIALNGKIFPVFSIISFLNTKKFFLLTILITFLSIIYNYNNFLNIGIINAEYIQYFSYGIPSISIGIFKILPKIINLNLNLEYIYIKYGLIVLSIFLGIFFFLKGFLKKNHFEKFKLNSNEVFFLAGAGIYLGTYVFISNWDYRLMFLILTIPFICKIKKNFYVYIFLVSMFISINSIMFNYLFQSESKFSILFLSFGMLIHALKFYIFLFFSYYYGKILKKLKNF